MTPREIFNITESLHLIYLFFSTIAVSIFWNNFAKNV